jgi:hypothetical protein
MALVNHRPMNIWLHAKRRTYVAPDNPEDSLDDAEGDMAATMMTTRHGWKRRAHPICAFLTGPHPTRVSSAATSPYAAMTGISAKEGSSYRATVTAVMPCSA